MSARTRRIGNTALPGPSVGLLTALRASVGDPGQVQHRAIDRVAMSHDASHYVLTPQVVVAPASADEVSALLRTASDNGTHLTFRSGGTSLSGQAITDGVLVDTRRHFREIDVLDGGLRVRVQPGAVIRQVNGRLAPFGRKLGPDPASESACTVGGVVANNSSGMACGVKHNSYSTLESAVLVLPTGNVIDTGAPEADERLRALEPDLHAGLLRLRNRITSNRQSVATIQRLFAMKNTMGYGLNSFLDHELPVKILEHLVVGSEGTLAFVAQATFRTVPRFAESATGLLLFGDLTEATRCLPALVDTAPETVELLDASSLRVAQLDPSADDNLRSIHVDRHAALLLEYQAPSREELAEATTAATRLLRQLPLARPATLTHDSATRNRLWHLRKGLYAAVAGARPAGSTALLEDVVVPVPALLPLCERLTHLLERNGYQDSVIFGHAKDGNIHFMLNEYFADPSSLDRYHGFTEELVDLVLGQGGSLKAEHGTGRMMAPYVRRQYGDELYGIMREVKALFDPEGLLNPGVLIADDPQIHVQHLKETSLVDPEVDRCVECGYCEPVCPSRDLTTTPRQRIVLRREIAAAQSRGDHALARELLDDYDYAAVQTCAVDGMCETACPVHINTGDLVRRLRSEGAGRLSTIAWEVAANHWKATTRTFATSLDVAASLPKSFPRSASRLGRRLLNDDVVPLWTDEVPAGGQPRPAGQSPTTARAVLFSSCMGSIFGPTEGHTGATTALLTLCDRAGIELAVPTGLADLCCGTPWKSKGMTAGYHRMRDRVVPALMSATSAGALPIVCDASSCSEGLTEMLSAGTAQTPLRVIDAVQFVAEDVLPAIAVVERLRSVAVHPTCSSTRLGINEPLLTIARAIAEDVVVPDDWGCCAFAGDRGMLHPDLTASATGPEAASLESRTFAAYASCNRTCEMGMTRATGHQYQHVLELLESVSRTHRRTAKPPAP